MGTDTNNFGKKLDCWETKDGGFAVVSSCDGSPNAAEELLLEYDRLQSENRRLREALKEIIGLCPYTQGGEMFDIADNTLKQVKDGE